MRRRLRMTIRTEKSQILRATIGVDSVDVIHMQGESFAAPRSVVATADADIGTADREERAAQTTSIDPQRIRRVTSEAVFGWISRSFPSPTTPSLSSEMRNIDFEVSDAAADVCVRAARLLYAEVPKHPCDRRAHKYRLDKDVSRVFHRFPPGARR